MASKFAAYEDEMIQMYQGGMSSIQIAKEFKQNKNRPSISSSGVLNILKQNNISIRAQFRHTFETLNPIIQSSLSWGDVLRNLGIATNGKNHNRIKALAIQLGIDFSHFKVQVPISDYDSILDDRVAEAVSVSSGFQAALTFLNLPKHPKESIWLWSKIKENNLNNSHWRIKEKYISKRQLKSSEKILIRYNVKGAPKTPEAHLLDRAITEEGREERCEHCKRTHHNGKPIQYQYHHIDGDHYNCLPVNVLRLCACCHTQTDTHASSTNAALCPFSPGGQKPLSSNSLKKHFSEVLVKGNKRLESYILRRAMKESGIPYVCKCCGCGPEWENQTMRLEADHINGDNTDNRPENVQFLDPNCHYEKTCQEREL